MKKNFQRKEVSLPDELQLNSQSIELLTPLRVEPVETKSPIMIGAGVLVIGAILAMVAVSFGTGARTFSGGYSIIPGLGMMGIMALLFRGFSGGSTMSRGKMDALRALYYAEMDKRRKRVEAQADRLDNNYRWFHPPTSTLLAAVGGERMWERSHQGRDDWFGTVRIGVGITSLNGQVVTFTEPADMPTKAQMEPATGKYLQEMVRYQSVAYGAPAMISLVEEPGFRIGGPRDVVLAMVRSLIAQMTFSHGPDQLRLVVITSDRDAWESVKWLPHVGDINNPDRADAAGEARMVYDSVDDFLAAQKDPLNLGSARGSFVPRHPGTKTAIPTPVWVVINDTDDVWPSNLMNQNGLDGMAFFDLGINVPACSSEGDDRTLIIDQDAMVTAVPRQVSSTAAHASGGREFFAVADLMSEEDFELFAQEMAGHRLAEGYESTDDVDRTPKARTILGHYGIYDPGKVNFPALWAARSDPLSPEHLKFPIGNRVDNGELIVLDIKEASRSGVGPHGLFTGFTGSGKTTGVRSLMLALMTGHHPELLQIVGADCKGGAGVLPFRGTPHMAGLITDLEGDQSLIDRFLDALWGEIARRKEVFAKWGVDDWYEYQKMRIDRLRANRPADEVPPPLACLVILVDEFSELFRLKPEAVEAFDGVGKQGRAFGMHMLLASQKVESRANKFLEHIGYRLVLKANTQDTASAAGVPQAYYLDAKVGLGYLRAGGPDNLTKLQLESLWREYRAPGLVAEDAIEDDMSYALDYFEPQLFSTSHTPLAMADSVISVDSSAGAEGYRSVEQMEDMLLRPTIGHVMIEQLRAIDFTPEPFWQGTLSSPMAVDELVNRECPGGWQNGYGQRTGLTIPFGVIDRPYKNDLQTWENDFTRAGSLLVVGKESSGKTTTLQSLICAASMLYTPEQVQFYCLSLSGQVLNTVAALPHVGSIATPTDHEGIRRIIESLVRLLSDRQLSFQQCGSISAENFRARRAGIEPGPVPQDGYGDVFLVIDNIDFLTRQDSPVRNAERLADSITTLIKDGPAYAIHVVGAARRKQEVAQKAREAFSTVVELKLGSAIDTGLVKPRDQDQVPGGRPGRGMVPQNYVREGVDPTGLHTLVARPALESTDAAVFDSSSVAQAVGQVVGSRWRPARPVPRAPERITLAQIRADFAAAVGSRKALMWAVDEWRSPVLFDPAQSPHLVVTGKGKCGKTTTLGALMSDIARVYAPGGSRAVVDPADQRPRAQVWLVDPRRHLTPVLGSDYVEEFAFDPTAAARLASNLVATLGPRRPGGDVTLENALSQSWTGPEIFLVIDDAHMLPAGPSHPLYPLEPFIHGAADVGLRVILARSFGGFSNVMGDPVLKTLNQSSAPLLVMSSDAEYGPVRNKWKGHPMPPGQGFLFDQDGAGTYLQVGQVAVGGDSSPN